MDQEKKTRGKQKIEMKKIENEKDLLITFTKRKSGIQKKASELTTLCGAKVDILMFSPSGKTFCFGEPSLQSMTRTSLNEENPSSENVKLVEEQKNLEINGTNEKNDALLDKLYGEKAREKELGGMLEIRSKCGWWGVKVQDLTFDQFKGMEASLVELQNKLMDELSFKEGEIDANSLALIIGQTSGLKPYPTNATCGSDMDISEVAFGGINNEAYGNDHGDLFDIVFSPKNNQGKGTGKSAAIATSSSSVPTKETQGGTDDASGSKENADGSGGGQALSSSDQILIQKAEAFLMSDDIAIDDEDAADFSFPIL